MKVLTKFVTTGDLKIRVSIEAPLNEQMGDQQVEETKAALRGLGWMIMLRQNRAIHRGEEIGFPSRFERKEAVRSPLSSVYVLPQSDIVFQFPDRKHPPNRNLRFWLWKILHIK